MATPRPAPAASDATPDTPTPPVADLGAGTSDATPDVATGDGSGDALPPASDELQVSPTPKLVPGAADFDVNAPGVSSAELQEHFNILSLRKQLADLDKQPVTSAVAVAKATPAPHDPTDILAVKDGEERYFTRITWDAMETKGEHGGWEVAVAKPSDLL